MITRKTVDDSRWYEVIRMPRLKVLRFHLFGIPLGLAALTTHFFFSRDLSPSFLWWFVIAYFFGAIFSLIYNYLSYLYIRVLHPEWAKIWFYYDPASEVNIIKTPIPKNDWDSTRQDLYEGAEFKVFDHELYSEMKNPYTIVFVANPLIEHRNSPDDDDNHLFNRDPIIGDDNLFLKTIERALFSFEFNEVVGRPDIWSKIRIILIKPRGPFPNASNNPEKPTAVTKKQYEDDYQQQSFVREFRGELEASGNPGEVALDTFAGRMLIAQEQVTTYVRSQLKDTHIDVIYAISGSTTHDISTAFVSDYDEKNEEKYKGKTFSFSIDPYCQKRNEVDKHKCEEALCKDLKDEKYDKDEKCNESNPLVRYNGPDRLLLHEFFPDESKMGRIAMSAWDVRTKVPIHEFAHAMSSVEYGKIVDEYYDRLKFVGEVPDPSVPINRIERTGLKDKHHIPVHNIFARYNGHIYESDRQHHIATQGWAAYFPERRKREVYCTMDAAQDVFEFDELLRDFIYDRLWVKVNRDFLYMKRGGK